MCWALALGFVLASPVSESPLELEPELDDEPELAPELLEALELLEPELPHAATTTAHTAATSVSRSRRIKLTSSLAEAFGCPPPLVRYATCKS
jgi:hypothetical protein